jgi:hypothetical protein
MKSTPKVLLWTSFLLVAVFAAVIFLWMQFPNVDSSRPTILSILTTWAPVFLMFSAPVLLLVTLLSFFLRRRASSAGMA